METNERVNDTYNNMQMPKVENKTIVIDDYSMCPHWLSVRGILDGLAACRHGLEASH